MALKTINDYQLLDDNILDSIYFDEQPSLALHTATVGIAQQNNLYVQNARAVLEYNFKYQEMFPAHTPILWAAAHQLYAESLLSIEDQAANFVTALLQVQIPTILVVNIVQYTTLPTLEDIARFIAWVKHLLYAHNQYVSFPRMFIKGNTTALNSIFNSGDNLNTDLWLEEPSINSAADIPSAWQYYSILEYAANLHCFDQERTTAAAFIEQLYNLSYQIYPQATILGDNNLVDPRLTM